MKKREKILAGVVLGFVALFVLGFAIKGFFVKPLKNVDKQVAAIREQINKINEERRAYFAGEDSTLVWIARKIFCNPRARRITIRRTTLAPSNASIRARIILSITSCNTVRPSARRTRPLIPACAPPSITVP